MLTQTINFFNNSIVIAVVVLLFCQICGILFNFIHKQFEKTNHKEEMFLTMCVLFSGVTAMIFYLTSFVALFIVCFSIVSNSVTFVLKVAGL